MRTLFIIPLVLMSLVSFPSWGEVEDDLVIRAGLYYKKFTAVPFSGEVEGKWRGSFKEGKKDGPWERYYENGQLADKGVYQNGVRDGNWISYHQTGRLWYERNYEDGEQSGYTKEFYPNGRLLCEGMYSEGKKEGVWLWYYDDGTPVDEWTGLFKNGMKISP